MQIKTYKERWFKIEEDDQGGEILLRELKDGDRQQIYQAAIKTDVVQDEHGKPMVKMASDTIREKQETLKKVIVDWKNFKSEKGKDIPCNEGNIIMFSKENGFIVLVEKYLTQLNEMLEKEEETERKNSKK